MAEQRYGEARTDERPEADVAEQAAETGTGAPTDDRPVSSDTLEANEADVAEQLSIVPDDEEDYR